MVHIENEYTLLKLYFNCRDMNIFLNTYIEVSRLWTQLQHYGAFVDLTYLLMHLDILFAGTITGAVPSGGIPSEEIQVFENLLV